MALVDMEREKENHIALELQKDTHSHQHKIYSHILHHLFFETKVFNVQIKPQTGASIARIVMKPSQHLGCDTTSKLHHMM
ncbi:hypothetical protein Lal_00021668 [Lupinus albus]|nr:hypothetical protein Lal_00021668 [Lupinus albus]